MVPISESNPEELLAPLLLVPLLIEELPAAVSVAVIEAVEDVPADVPWTSGSGGCPAFRKIRFIDETDGIEFGSQIPCANNWSRISHAKRLGLSDFNLRIRLTTDGVATCWNVLFGGKQEQTFENIKFTIFLQNTNANLVPSNWAS